MSVLGRVDGWEEKLGEVIATYEQRGHSWGGGDCLTFSLHGAQVVTGEDWIKKLQLGYGTEEEAYAEMKERGFSSLREGFAWYFEEIPVAMAHRGDLGIIVRPEAPLIEAACIILGSQAVTMSLHGLARVPLTWVTYAFATRPLPGRDYKLTAPYRQD
jgi:hypothetical protein